MGSKSAIGIGNGICFKQVQDKGGGSYIDPLVHDSIVGLWKFDQNTNESSTRNIIKNTIKDKGGDLELLNFGYKLNSGYNGYVEDFSLFILSNRFEYSEISNTKVTITAVLNNSTGIYHSVTEKDSALYWNTFKIKVSGSTDDVYISYITNTKHIRLYNGINTVVVPNDLSWHSFTASKTDTSCNITLEFVPLYEGALVTDGKDDMIVSQKTVQEMLGGSKEITVVSMIHQIGRVATNTNFFTNCIQANTDSKGCNIVNYQTSLGKTGIYGYSRANVSVANNEVVINNILGDKADYLTNVSIGALTSNEKFSVVGYLDVSPQQVTSVAVYWTFIANKVLTTNEINQIIGYFKLDKYVTPQVIYDIKRQGLTNDTPAADWYLKDFSGNGHDMQLYNYAKKGNSGVGKYEEDFTSWRKTSSLNLTSSGFTIKSVNDFNHADWILWSYLNTSPKSFKIRVNGSPNNSLLVYRYQKDGSTIVENMVLNKDGVYELPASIYVQNGNGFRVNTRKSDLEKYIGLSVEQIPDYEGALVSDGKDDYGHADNLPIFKDYTVAIDRAWINSLDKNQCLATKNPDPNWGAFNFELLEGTTKNTYSFGEVNNNVSFDANRKISYQSKYSYNGTIINMGNVSDGKDLFLFRSRSLYPYYAEAAIWSYLLFPYSLSEFLLERQLKKYKLGTLYPDMVEWRPKVNINVPVVTPPTFSINNGSDIITNGQYIPEGTEISIRIFTATDGSVEGINEATAKINGVDIELTPSGNKTYYGGKFIISSKQKIDITIDEYIRFEDIVQPYPVIVNLSQNGKSITWGDKLKVGSEVTFVNHINILPEIYAASGRVLYNEADINGWNSPIVVAKSMVFTNVHIWKLNTIEPHAIYLPQKLNIPNSSLKLLGYVPDLTGKGNHGKLNNFAYTEDSGVAADGSIKFDGTDDYITIPTLAHGGKCVMMKVNTLAIPNVLYDQRINSDTPYFAIYNEQSNDYLAYNSRNENGNTYIDGILNKNIYCSQLAGITHNINITNEEVTDSNSQSPTIGSTHLHTGGFAKMAMYEFMLFSEIPSEDEIKKLNDVMGIEGGYVESPNYYWDAYGKKNTDTDRNLIADQVSKDVANALEVKNVGYNSESGYSQIVDTVLFKNWIPLGGATYMEYTLVNDTTINITKSNRVNIDAFYCRANVKKKSYYKITGLQEGQGIQFGFTNNIIYIAESDGVHEVDWSLVSENYQELSTTFVGDCNITIEQVAQYPNGLVSDGVEDHLINTAMPILTDYTWIVKRKWLDLVTYQTFVHKGAGIANNAAFLFEYIEGGFYTRSFSNVGESKEFPELISYQTKNNYNGTSLTPGSISDGNQLRIFMGSDQYPRYTKAVFYKAMLYDKTIDQLSINMLKNLFERDELIDVTNPIFKKEEL